MQDAKAARSRSNQITRRRGAIIYVYYLGKKEGRKDSLVDVEIGDGKKDIRELNWQAKTFVAPAELRP